MVTAVESSELSRDLPQMLARVRTGDRFLITEAGEVVAVLIPATNVAESVDRASVSDQEAVTRAIAALKAARDKRAPASWQEIREWVNEGRR